ncbi:unnamed protein product, partial [Candidula unifasciata]
RAMERNESIHQHLLFYHLFSFCRPSANLSRQSLATNIVSCFSLAYLSASSLILAALSFLVLSIFIDIQPSACCSSNHKPEGSETETTSLLRENHCNASHYEADNALMKAGFALSSFVLSTCLCCLMVCSMQFFFTSKILTAAEGKGR